MLILPASPSAAGTAAGGGLHTLVVRTTDNSLWAWGDNTFGQLGDGTTTVRRTPTQVVGLSGVVAVTAGAYHSLALTSTGVLWAWGHNTYGQLGNGNNSTQTSPVQVMTGVSQIAAGNHHSIALKTDGTVWSWGRNTEGALGDGGLTNRNTPYQVTGLGLVSAVAARGNHTLVVLAAGGALKSWGANASGQLGDGLAYTSATNPVSVAAVSNAILPAAAPASSYALRFDGALYAWGANDQGQLGFGDTTQRPTPEILPTISGVAAVAPGGYHAVALLTNGTLAAWGWNAVGSVGDGSGIPRPSPVPIPGLISVSAVGAGGYHNVAVTFQGEVWAWGYNNVSQLGDGSTITRFSPVKIAEAGFAWKVATPALSVSSGTYSADLNVTISCATVGATIRYTADGTDPTTASEVYSAPVEITASTVLKARAFKEGFTDSDIRAGTYSLKVARPSFNPPGGDINVYELPRLVEISTSTTEATLRYTTDGTTPTESSPQYVEPLSIGPFPAGTTVRLVARGFRTGWSPSDQYATEFRVVGGQLPPPETSNTGGTYLGSVTVALRAFLEDGITPAVDPDGTVWEAGTALRYTIDGTNPTSLSPLYQGPVYLDRSTTLKAKVWNPAYTESAVNTQVYAIQVVAPTLSLPSGAYPRGTEVVVTNADPGPGVSLHYTLDGADPTSHDNAISSGDSIAIEGSFTLKVLAYRPGCLPSAVTTATFSATRPVLAAGAAHSLALTSEGDAWAWGANWSGQLGNSTANLSPVPVPVPVLADAVAIAGGCDHSLAATSTGSVWAWGDNSAGQLGDGTTDGRPTPAEVASLTGVVAVASGCAHSLALRSDGSVWAWGANLHGQIGNGTTANALSPVQVPGLTGVIAIAAGSDHSLAVKSDGSVWAWGANWEGQLGNGTTNQALTPDQVDGLQGITALSAGEAHSLALSSDGTVWAWGANYSGQLGDGTTDTRLLPIEVSGLEGVVAIASGGEHNLAIGPDGAVWSWGGNWAGQLGDGTTDDRPTPASLPTPTAVAAIAAGYEHSLALTEDGEVHSWGGNSAGQLGSGGVGSMSLSPVSISGPGLDWRTASPTFSPPNGTFSEELDVTILNLDPAATIRFTDDGTEPTEASTEIASSETYHVSATTTLKAGAWRLDRGPSAIATAVFTVEIAVVAPTANPPAGTYPGGVHVGLASQTPDAEIHYTTDGTEPTLTSPPYQGLIMLIGDTTLKARAFREAGEPSPTSTFNYTISPRVGTVAAGGAFSMALTPSGAVWAWGAGDAGQLGTGSTLGSLIPLPIEALTDGVAISAGAEHALALREGGAVAVWGANSSGQLGNGVVGAGEPAPVAVDGLDRIVAVAAGGAHSLALRDDGRVYSWGSNAFGQLGDGTTDDRSLPGVVPSLVNIVAIAAGESHSLALGADGRVWGWGNNAMGQVGDGSGVDQAAPIAVLEGAVSIAAGARHSLATKGDGSGWAWGDDGDGQLGNGDDAEDWVPTLVVDAWCNEVECGSEPFTEVKRLDGGGVHTLGLRADGGLWSWGGNDAGQLGQDDPSGWRPIGQVSGLTDVVAFAAGGQHSLAVTATGEIWSWGDNAQGQAGDCTANSRHLPVRVAGPEYAFLGCQPPPQPTFSVPSGTYTAGEGLAVRVSCLDEEARIRYTFDGSDPDEGASEVPSEGLLWLDHSLTLKARAWASHGAASEVAAASYVLRAAAPVFVPEGGDFTAPQQVVVSSPTASAVVHYTTDGSQPTSTSPACCPAGGIAVATTMTLRAVAIPQREGWLPSDTASADYRMHFGVAPVPTFSPAAGTYTADQMVVIDAVPGAVVHYTSDGSPPTLASPAYAGPIDVSAPVTLRAFVVHPDYELSPVVSSAYRLKAPRPALSLGTGSYQGPQVVVVELPAWDGSIHFTTTGADPTLTDPAVASGQALPVNQSLPLKVRAFKTGWLPGDVASANYSIFEDAVSPVTATPAGGGHATPLDVSLATITPGAVVRYTLDGTEPSAASAVYSELIHIADTTVLKARAFRGGWVPSDTLTEEYRFDAGRIATPVFSPPPGTYATRRMVRVTCDTADTTLRYTVDGTEPDAGATLLAPADEIRVAHTLRLRVRAFKEGLAPSDVRSGDYLITGAVAAGKAHSLALDADGTLWASGANDAGQLGLGTLEARSTFVAVPGLADVEMIAAGRAHSLAVTADGGLWAWGSNEHGQLGDGTSEAKAAPVPVAGSWVSPIVAIAAGDDFSLAVSLDGTVWSWGAGSEGQLGIGAPQDRDTPGAAVGLPAIVSAVAGAGHVLALDSLGQVWSWGRNDDGQAGDGTTIVRTQPQPVAFAGPTAPTIVRLAAGQAHSLAVDEEGGLWTWGRNDWGQLGHDEPLPSQPTPARLPDSTEFRIPAGGESFSISIAGTGQALAWGRNDAGQLGDGSSTRSSRPQPVLGLEEVAKVAAGSRHGLAIGADGVFWAWGANELGQLGDGTAATRRLPAQPILDRLVGNQNVNEDPDADALSTATEQRLGTDPYNADTNGDGIPDGVSAGAGANPLSEDTDSDGLTNANELMLGTNPQIADTDGDGFPDGVDVFPLDPTRWSSAPPGAGDTTPPTITIWDPRNAVRIP